MRQPAEERAGQAFFPECGGPFIEEQVRRDDGGATFIALADEFEEKLGASLRQRDEAEFVDDEELYRRHLLLQA